MSASLRADMVSENTNLGLSKKYKDPESDIGKWLKTFFGLSYLDSSDVADCFVFDILLDAPDDEKAMEFVDCILNTYVDDNAKFSRQIWAVPNLDTKRTTNGCENFHRQLGTMFYHSHPNIFNFVEKRKSIQTKNHLKICGFISGTINRKEYIHIMAYKSLPVSM